MKRQANNQKKIQKKSADISNINNANKKSIPIEDNNKTIDNFFTIRSHHKSTVSNSEQPQARQDPTKLNKAKNESKKNYKLSKYNFYESKTKENLNIKKLMKINNEENKNKIDVSKYILFSENFNGEIYNIFNNNFIRSFKNFLEKDFQVDEKIIKTKQKLNITKNSFNKFIQPIFSHFLTKYLLNQYPDLIYVSTKYIDNIIRNDYSEIELLSKNDASNIYLEYSPINLNESNLFHPELTKNISHFIKKFRQKKHKKKENQALLLYRPGEDFTSFINKLRLIFDQLGYNLLIKEDEANKLISFEKLKLINQNYIIGSLKDKNKKYLQIINNLATTNKWKNFIEINNINLKEEKDTYKSKKISRTQNISKSQSTINTTQALSKKIIRNKTLKIKEDVLSNTLLTFIGHGNSNDIETQEKNSENYNSKENIIAKNYQQNILEKFNKRKNVILFLDNFEDNEENNIKYINQINGIIPTSKSPIIILTNNLYLFSNNIVNGNSAFQSRYKHYQIENEGISQKENVIYITFLIIYFIAFFPKAVIENEISNEKKNAKNLEINDENINKEKLNEKNKEKELEKEMDFIIHIKDDENDEEDNNNKNYDYNLNKIKKVINNIFIKPDYNLNKNKLYNILLALSYIITILNHYEIDNILVYLKNLFQFIYPKLYNIHIKPNIMNTLSLLQSTILEDIEEYKMEDNNYINSPNEDISKISEMFDNDSFNDYEYGYINKVGERQYEEKLKNYGINKGIDYNKESYFYTNEFFKSKNNIIKFNYISNKEIEERIIEDHKFFQNYYSSSNSNLNHSDIMKINMILVQIIMNENISLKDISRFIDDRPKNNKNNDIMHEKFKLLNKIFRKSPEELFIKYINAHIGVNYYTEFNFDNKKYCIPEKLLFYNYYNDYYLMAQIKSEEKSNYSCIEDDDDDDENDFNSDEESELNEEEDE